MPNPPITTAPNPGEADPAAPSPATRASLDSHRSTAAYGLFWLDLSGSVSRWCEECAELFGLSREQALGTPLEALMLPEDREAGRARAILAAAARDGSWQGSGWRVRGDGSLFWAATSVARVRTPNGLDIGYMVVTHDLTGLVSNPVDRLVTEGTAHLVSVGRMASDVSHDMRNIFSAIRGFAGLLERHLPPDGRCHGAWHELLKACDRGTSLTTRLVDVGRGEPGDGGTCDLAEVLRDAEPLLRQVLPERIALRVVSDESLPRVPVSPVDMELTVLNLVVNARDAIEADGTISVVATAQVDAAPSGQVSLLVRDDGRGMEPSVAARAFERRFTTKEAGLGTGLGLALVRETVARAGGSVELESTPGGGTRVAVRLPVAEGSPVGRIASPASTGAASTADAPADRGRTRAVVCCDSGLLGECVTELLRREGIQIQRLSFRETFASGVEADLLLVEAAALRRDATTEAEAGRAGHRPPAVWLTDAGSEPDTLLRQPGDVVVEWPFSPDELLLEIRALGAREAARAAVH